MKRIILTGLLIFFAVCVSADIDFPKPTGFVNDFANILTDAEEDVLKGITEELEGKTTAELSIVTLDTVKPLTIEEYSVRLFEKWGIGKKDKDNGVLVLVAVDDREIKIEVGYGLEGVLPDGLCGEIIRRSIIPAFKNGRYGSGIIAGVNEIAGVISGGRMSHKYVPKHEIGKVSEIKNFVGVFISILFFSFFILAAIMQAFLPRRRYGSRWGGGSSWGSFGGSGFGGFGGGRSGGGGAVGKW